MIHSLASLFCLLLTVTLNMPTVQDISQIADASTEFSVMSYNIRYNNPGDGIYAWPNRKDRVANLIKYYQPALLGLQEALLPQLKYLDESLPDYDWIGVGRDDGKQNGEYSPIFYRKDTFELLEWGTYWLSESPDKPSRGWDASLPRIMTWGRFVHKQQGDTICYFNTHFDHRGEQAREQSALLITKKVAEVEDQSAVIVTGDFNAIPESKPYQNMVASGLLADAYHSSMLPNQGAETTFSGFEVSKGLTPDRRIDYVFVGEDIRVLKHAIITDHTQGAYPSDHLPVLAVVSL